MRQALDLSLSTILYYPNSTEIVKDFAPETELERLKLYALLFQKGEISECAGLVLEVDFLPRGIPSYETRKFDPLDLDSIFTSMLTTNILSTLSGNVN